MKELMAVFVIAAVMAGCNTQNVWVGDLKNTGDLKQDNSEDNDRVHYPLPVPDPTPYPLPIPVPVPVPPPSETNQPPVDPPQPGEPTSAEMLQQIGNDAVQGVKVLTVENTFSFENGDWIKFIQYNAGDYWSPNGEYSVNDTVGHFNANDQFRYGIFDVVGEDHARHIGANQLEDSASLPMPALKYSSATHWKTSDSKTMYDIDDANLYTIRVVDKMKSTLGITSKMVSAVGKVLE